MILPLSSLWFFASWIILTMLSNIPITVLWYMKVKTFWSCRRLRHGHYIFLSDSETLAPAFLDHADCLGVYNTFSWQIVSLVPAFRYNGRLFDEIGINVKLTLISINSLCLRVINTLTNVINTFKLWPQIPRT